MYISSRIDKICSIARLSYQLAWLVENTNVKRVRALLTVFRGASVGKKIEPPNEKRNAHTQMVQDIILSFSFERQFRYAYTYTIAIHHCCGLFDRDKFPTLASGIPQ